MSSQGSSVTAGNQRERNLLAGSRERLPTSSASTRAPHLSGQNTNLKASALSFGPAAQTLAEFDAGLSRSTAKHAGGARPWLRHAYEARVGLLRHPGAARAPHIAEESDEKMDQMEGVMRQEEQQVGQDLAALAATPELAGDQDLAAAMAAFHRYLEIEAQHPQAVAGEHQRALPGSVPPPEAPGDGREPGRAERPA